MTFPERLFLFVCFLWHVLRRFVGLEWLGFGYASLEELHVV